MNAPVQIASPAPDSDVQSLLARCKDKRWKLLQQFACLEIELAQQLDQAPRTFGAKMRTWIKHDPSAKQFESLIVARNLLAHAFVHCFRSESVTYALWQVADGTSELNCAKFDDKTLTIWSRDLAALLSQAIAKANATR